MVRKLLIDWGAEHFLWWRSFDYDWRTFKCLLPPPWPMYNHPWPNNNAHITHPKPNYNTSMTYWWQFTCTYSMSNHAFLYPYTSTTYSWTYIPLPCIYTFTTYPWTYIHFHCTHISRTYQWTYIPLHCMYNYVFTYQHTHEHVYPYIACLTISSHINIPITMYTFTLHAPSMSSPDLGYTLNTYTLTSIFPTIRS